MWNSLAVGVGMGPREDSGGFARTADIRFRLRLWDRKGVKKENKNEGEKRNQEKRREERKKQKRKRGGIVSSHSNNFYKKMSKFNNRFVVVHEKNCKVRNTLLSDVADSSVPK